MNASQTRTMLGWGLAAGAIAVLLAMAGNPANMALCAACFIRDIAGSLGLHQLKVAAYLRPEIVGLILGATISSTRRGEYKAQGGASPITRFILGMVMMIGALVFLGCPTRMVLRMASGDLSAYVGLLGLVAGVGCGTWFLRRGFTLGQPQLATHDARTSKYAFTAMAHGTLLLSLVTTGFVASASGPGSQHAPVLVSLFTGIGFGVIAQRTRMCYSGAFRNLFLARNAELLYLVLGTFLAMLAYQLLSGQFTWALYGPIAHGASLWNILGLFVVGFAAVLLGGCPLRQLILSGQGSWDAATTVLGMLCGSAIAHNFKLASAPGKAELLGGPGPAGKIAVAGCMAVLFVVAASNRVRRNP